MNEDSARFRSEMSRGIERDCKASSRRNRAVCDGLFPSSTIASGAKKKENNLIHYYKLENDRVLSCEINDALNLASSCFLFISLNKY